MSLLRELIRGKPYYSLGGLQLDLPSCADATLITMDTSTTVDIDLLATEARPPFDNIWIEWLLPNGSHVACHCRCLPSPTVMASLSNRMLVLRNLTSHKGTRQRELLGVGFVPLSLGGFLLTSDIDDHLNLLQETVKSLIERATGRTVPGCNYRDLREPGDAKGVLSAFWSNSPDSDDSLGVAITTECIGLLCLLNCRNIALRPESSGGRLGRHRNGKQRGFTWHRLVVVKPGEKRGSVVGADIGHHLTREHIVRGHFKEFTEESKLFGRYTGRFWWNASTRGDRALGRVDKDYEIRGRPE